MFDPSGFDTADIPIRPVKGLTYFVGHLRVWSIFLQGSPWNLFLNFLADSVLVLNIDRNLSPEAGVLKKLE